MEQHVLELLKVLDVKRIKNINITTNSVNISFFNTDTKDCAKVDEILGDEEVIVSQEVTNEISDARKITDEELDMLMIVDPLAYEEVQRGDKE